MFKKSNNPKNWAVRQENSTFKHLQEDWPGPSTKDRTQTPPPTLILPSPQHTVSPCPPTTQWPTLCNASFFCPEVPILGPNAPPPTIWVTKAIRFLSHGDWLKATVLPHSCGNPEYIIPIQIYLLTGLNKNYRRPLFGCKLQHNPD